MYSRCSCNRAHPADLQKPPLLRKVDLKKVLKISSVASSFASSCTGVTTVRGINILCILYADILPRPYGTCIHIPPDKTGLRCADCRDPYPGRRALFFAGLSAAGQRPPCHEHLATVRPQCVPVRTVSGHCPLHNFTCKLQTDPAFAVFFAFAQLVLPTSACHSGSSL